MPRSVHIGQCQGGVGRALTGTVAGSTDEGERMAHTAGHHDLGNGCHAWLQVGGWGFSNAGLVVGDGESLLVDTLFDLAHTRLMLDGLAAVTVDAPIRTVVNTHGNGDHWFGNGLVPDAEIVAATGTIGEMRVTGPAMVHALKSFPGSPGEFASRVFGAFTFDGIDPVLPTRGYDGSLDLEVGGVDVRLLDLGPAHTAADTVVHVPAARTVFTGDLVFAGGTPIVWAGPIANWIGACRRMLELDVHTVVPGHGPVSTVESLRAVTEYLEALVEDAGARHAAGMPVDDAVLDIARSPAWRQRIAAPEAERLAANVRAVYRELDPGAAVVSPPELFGCMGELADLLARREPDR